MILPSAPVVESAIPTGRHKVAEEESTFSSPLLSFRGHLPALDGLRGIAVLMVLIGHLYQKSLIADSFPLGALLVARIVGFGGYGVELFFVLSGFLITGILLDTRHERNAALNFYVRRILRIFPLYYGALIIILFVLPHFVTLDDGGRLIVSRQIWLWTYLANWPGGYVWDDSNVFLLGHFWSLSVEEHFYIFWPLLVGLLSPRKLFVFCIALVGLGVVSRSATALMGASQLSLWAWPTLQKVDGLAVGSMIAIALRNPGLRPLTIEGRRFRLVFSILLAGCLVLMWLPRKLSFPVVGVFAETLVVLFFGAVLLYALQLRRNGACHGILTSKTLMTFGKYSYGLYIIHGILRPWFETTFNMTNLPRYSILPICYQLIYYVLTIGISFALAYLSFHLYEKHWLSLKRFFEYQ